MSYAQALALTLALEVPAYALSLRWGLRTPLHRGLCAGLIVNLASHPSAFLLVMPWLTPALGYIPALAVTELGVWIFEALLLWVWLRRDPDLIGIGALGANALSLSIGVLLLS